MAITSSTIFCGTEFSIQCGDSTSSSLPGAKPATYCSMAGRIAASYSGRPCSQPNGMASR